MDGDEIGKTDEKPNKSRFLGDLFLTHPFQTTSKAKNNREEDGDPVPCQCSSQNQRDRWWTTLFFVGLQHCTCQVSKVGKGGKMVSIPEEV